MQIPNKIRSTLLRVFCGGQKTITMCLCQVHMVCIFGSWKKRKKKKKPSPKYLMFTQPKGLKKNNNKPNLLKENILYRIENNKCKQHVRSNYW